MNDEQLKKKLSALKSAQVPKNYWTGYWPRLQARLEREKRKSGAPEKQPSGFPWLIGNNWFVPALTAFFMGVAGYRLASYQTAAPIPPFADAPVQLASLNGETQAQHVFRQMLELFPKRVNWISFVDGKVDFSISSVAYPDSKELIPLIVTFPREQEPFEVRFLIRPGQSAHVEAAWDSQTQVVIHIQVNPNGQKALVNCRLNGSGVEAEVDISQEDVQPLGSFRSGERLVEAQLTRVKPGKAHADK